MGGCVSSPKDLALNEGEEAPVETPASPKKVETEAVAQEKTHEGGDEKTEELLVAVSEPKAEAVETKPEEAVATIEATAEIAPVEEPKAGEKKEEPLVTL